MLVEEQHMSTYQDILRAASNLATEERLQLIETLWETLSPDHWPVPSPDWQAEIQRRSEALDRGEMETQSWEEVRAAARKRAGLDG
jgi:putative addiction module component (TIGR02574 family)